MNWRAIYVLLWLTSLLVCSAPWVCVGNKCWSGWNFTYPFSFTYLLGLLLQLVAALTYYSPVALSLLSGVLMLLGVMGAISGVVIAEVFLGNSPEQAGLGVAFL